MNTYYLAIDIGASSGRHIIGWMEDGILRTEEVYRFPNGAKKENGHLIWEIETLTKEVIRGIRYAFAKYPDIESAAIDTWGCDYVLLSVEEEILPCMAYRDARTEAVIDEVHGRVSAETLYRYTGIQFQPFNTIYQLYEDKKRGRLENATDFLMMPEYLAYRLTGQKVKEYTNATTTGLVNARTEDWETAIFSGLDLPAKLFPKLNRPGEKVGMLLPEVAEEVGGDLTVVLCATHDTASAVEGIPMEGEELYISSGTWSLLGARVPQAITDAKSREANFTNEGGIGYIRYQKNIMGMWVVNRLREELCPDRSFARICEEAAASSFDEICDVNAPIFLSPESMKEAFNSMLKDRPQRAADYFRCAYLSLAESYRQAIDELEINTGIPFSKLYIVGGGAKNTFLNTLTAQKTGKQVIALPMEATSAGNLMLQMNEYLRKKEQKSKQHDR